MREKPPHHRAKLDEKKVREIRRLHAEGKSIQSLALKFKVSTATAGQIVHRDTWKWVV